MKGKTNFNQKNNLVYQSKCPNKNCWGIREITEEINRRLEEGSIDHKKQVKAEATLKCNTITYGTRD